jgi:hypothetical protein
MDAVSSDAAATLGFGGGGGAAASVSESELQPTSSNKQLARPTIGTPSSRGKRFILIMPLL